MHTFEYRIEEKNAKNSENRQKRFTIATVYVVFINVNFGGTSRPIRCYYDVNFFSA